MNGNIPRNEHPNPQFKRDDFEILNGVWQFEIDNAMSGQQRGMVNKEKYSNEIIVPFCPESKLSGIGNTDFMNAVWYKREFEVPQERLNGRTVIHFGAVDYKAVVYINGKEAIRHTGGFSSFEADISELVVAGTNTVVVYACDPLRFEGVPAGKQSVMYKSAGCSYTRTTGIWQTVWLEYTPKSYIKSVKYYTDPQNSSVTVQAVVVGDGQLETEITYEGRKMAYSKVDASGILTQTFRLAEKHLWEVGHGRLYNVKFTFGQDTVNSYFGLRSTGIQGKKYLLNGRPTYQRTVLDQGYYPDGIMTAPTEQALINDIEISMGLGFNGARLHQKVFEPLFLYHCDRLGYLVWGEYPNWCALYSLKEGTDNYLKILPEWLEVLERDFNHPSIIGWCPLNEVWPRPEWWVRLDQSWRATSEDVIREICVATKKYDPTRPCIDSSGGDHTDATDIFDLHDYRNDTAELTKQYEPFFERGDTPGNPHVKPGDYKGQPIFMSEYGGIGWKTEGVDGWGYVDIPTEKRDYLDRYCRLTKFMLKYENVMGFCYTQLYDVEQEINGIYTFDRRPKFTQEEMDEIRRANTSPAAMEK